MQQLEIGLLLLLALAACVAIVSNRVGMPYSIGLVIAGLLLGNVVSLPGPELTPALLFLVVLPGLLFEGAFGLDFREFWNARLSILTLAVPGSIASTALTAGILWSGINYWHPGAITANEALAFGALISATDPLSVLALFKGCRVDPRLCVIVEGEALFNDGTAVVVFTMVLGLAGGELFSWGSAALEFARVAGVAILVGAAYGVCSGLVIRSIDDAMIEITMTLLAAYGAFITAQLLTLSGVIACVVAGLIAGTWGVQGMKSTTRHASQAFWQYLAFLLNSVVFLLIGTKIHLATLAHYIPEIAIGWFAINLARAIVVYAKAALMRSVGNTHFPYSWATIIGWGGLRGSLSMVLALGLPPAFRHRDLILHTTYGVVLLTLIVQGLTIKPLLRVLKLAHDNPGPDI